MRIKHLAIVSGFLLGLATLAEAQPLRNTRPEYALKVAEESKSRSDYYNALEWYEKYYEQTKDRSVALEIAQLELMLRDYVKAETWFERVLLREKKSQTGDISPNTRFYYGQVLKMNGKYDEAIATFEEFIPTCTDPKLLVLAKVEMEGAKAAMKMKENTELTIENAGSKVNTPNNEYSPAISADGNTLYFAAMRSEDITKLNGKEGDYFAKIYSIQKGKNDKWTDAEPLSGDINRLGSNQGNVSFSADGKAMYFTRFITTGNEVTASTLFYSAQQADGSWGSAKEVAGLNGNYVVKNPAMGELYGKPVLFYASNQEGAKGGFDIYYANMLAEGSFGTPTNLGDVVNTFADDATPYYKDGKLYFSSAGHVGLGGDDLFVSNWNGTTWSQPENLGKGINSSANDRSISSDADGNMYFVSNRVGGKSLKSRTCCEDIYIAKRAPILIDLLAIATDGKKPLKDVEYTLSEIKDGKPFPLDPTTIEQFKTDLGRNKAYRLVAKKAGYNDASVEFNTVDLRKSTTIKQELMLKPIPVLAVSLKAKTLANGNALNNVSYQLVEKGGKTDNKTTDIYTTPLGMKKIFMLIASKQGYISDTVNFNTNDIVETAVIEKTLNLRPRMRTITRNEKIALPSIYYKLNKAAANDTEMENFYLAQQSLDYLYGIMVKYPEIVIELSAHTDARGSNTSNQSLSQRRADGVRTYLMEKGIAGTRIVAKGYGESQLVNACKDGVTCSEEDHLQNRRTEFKILSGPTSIEISEQTSN
jgi:outer membrane protein OmpA-like peptidoglycan-associated protein/tetratricopeptide (TPR) repeat protein